MKKSQKPCRKIGCPNLTREGYCDEHKQEKQQKDKEYNQNRDPIHVSFYKSKEWREVRKQAIIRDSGLCVMCYAKGIFQEFDAVDHIIEMKDDFSLRATLENLQCLCHACHNAKTFDERKKRNRSREL
jgi:5-methylcytosine-specific restriction protein A